MTVHLRLRRAQLEVLAEERQGAFVEALGAHMQASYPEQCAALGEEGTRDAIAHGLARAEAHQLTRHEHIAQFVAVMFVLGRDFDTDARIPWAEAALGDTRRHDAGRRIATLVNLTRTFIDTLAPPTSSAASARRRPG